MHVAQPPQACPPKLFLSSVRCLFPRFWDTPNKAYSHTVRPEQAAPRRVYLTEWSAQHAALQKLHRHIASLRAP